MAAMFRATARVTRPSNLLASVGRRHGSHHPETEDPSPPASFKNTFAVGCLVGLAMAASWKRYHWNTNRTLNMFYEDLEAKSKQQ
jgi:hypothetical protein